MMTDIPAKAHSTNETTLFAASSPRAKAFFGQEQFEFSLHLNLLFNPGPLAFPSPFFSCPFLAEYVNGTTKGESWVEGALENGLIIPYVRDPSIRGFPEMWDKEINKAHSESVRRFIERLRPLSSSQYIQWRDWTPNVGMGFKNLVQRQLLNREIATLPELVQEFYVQSEPLLEILNESIIAPDTETKGLRMGAILERVAERYLGDTPIKDCEVDEVLSMIESLPLKNRNYPSLDIVRKFFKVLSELYNENMSAAFGVTNSVIDYDPLSAAFSSHPLAAQESLTKISRGEFPDVLWEEIKLPTIKRLKAMPFDRLLLDLRFGNRRKVFEEYVDNFMQWKEEPSSNLYKTNLKDSIQAYARNICELAGSKDNVTAYRATIGPPLGQLMDLAKNEIPAMVLGAALSHSLIAHLGEQLSHFGLGSTIAMAPWVSGVVGAVGGLAVKKQVTRIAGDAASGAFDSILHISQKRPVSARITRGKIEFLLPQ